MIAGTIYVAPVDCHAAWCGDYVISVLLVNLLGDGVPSCILRGGIMPLLDIRNLDH